MSFDIHWHNLNTTLQQLVQIKLNELIQKIKNKPSFIGDIELTHFEFGNQAPEVELLDIQEVDKIFYSNSIDYTDSIGESSFSEYYHRGVDPSNLYQSLKNIKQEQYKEDDVDTDLEEDEEDEEELRFHHHQPLLNQYQNKHEQTDHVQFKLKINYEGDMNCSLNTKLLINFPMKEFGFLPLQLKVTGFKLKAIFLVAYLQSQIKLSLLPDEANEEFLKDLKIESNIGDQSKHCLKNVDQVERFLLETIRKQIRKSLLYPNFFEYNINS